MLRRQAKVGNLAAANAALIAASQTPVSGTALTLTGSQPDQARRILLTYGVEGSARTLVITGTGWEGLTQSETLSVPSGAGGTVLSALDYATITSAVPAGGGWSAAATLGTYGGGGAGPSQSSPWFAMDPWALQSMQIQVSVVGTITYTVEYSNDDSNFNETKNPNLAAAPTPAAMVWVASASPFAAATASAIGSATPSLWARVSVNAGGAAGATATMDIMQFGSPAPQFLP